MVWPIYYVYTIVLGNQINCFPVHIKFKVHGSSIMKFPDWVQVKKTHYMSHQSQNHFITQYISLRCAAVNEFYRMIRMGVAGHVRGNRTETDE